MTTIADTLREVQPIIQEVFSIAGESPQVFHWERYGFKMTIPYGALEPDGTCDIAVVAIGQGEFRFPENTQLVSAIYAIAMTRKLLQPATVEMEHCVDLKTPEQCNRLTFVQAHSIREDLPYVFEEIDGGDFSPQNSMGKISLDRFDQLAIVSRVRNTARMEAEARKSYYLAHLIYYQIDTHPPTWDIVFLITKRLKLTSEVCILKVHKKLDKNFVLYSLPGRSY